LFYVIMLLVYLHDLLRYPSACNLHLPFAENLNRVLYLCRIKRKNTSSLIWFDVMASRFKPTQIMNLEGKYLCICEQLDQFL